MTKKLEDEIQNKRNYAIIILWMIFKWRHLMNVGRMELLFFLSTNNRYLLYPPWVNNPRECLFYDFTIKKNSRLTPRDCFSPWKVSCPIKWCVWVCDSLTLESYQGVAHDITNTISPRDCFVLLPNSGIVLKNYFFVWNASIIKEWIVSPFFFIKGFVFP